MKAARNRATTEPRLPAREGVLERLWSLEPGSASSARGGDLPQPLGARYPGGLAIPLRADRPTLVANFVSSLDGVVALSPGEPSSGGAEISGHSEPDRFVMALLRALADVIVVGAGTARAGRHHEWTPRHVEPALAETYLAWRASLGLAPQPTTIVVTGSGDVDLNRPGLSAPDVPVILATTARGADRLAASAVALPANATVQVVARPGAHPAAAADVVPAAGIVEVARRAGARLILCEGGPHVFGELLAADLVDELFLTLAPQLLGRGLERRLGLVEGTAFGDAAPRSGSWLGPAATLASVRRAGDHLFLRYRLDR